MAAALPFLWTLWGSLKLEGDFFSLAGWRDALSGPRTLAATGSRFTLDAYRDVWIGRSSGARAQHRVVTLGVTAVSLTFGTLGGYALARSTQPYAYWVMVAALVFRAMPALTLVSGYLLPFFEWNIWGYRDPGDRAGGAQPALHALAAAELLPVASPATSTRARWWTAAPGSRPSASPSCR